MKIIIFLLVTVLLASCASSSKSPPISIRGSIEGAWGWTSKQCKVGAPIYSFSEDGSKMFISSENGMLTSRESEPKPKLIYHVIGESKNVLRMIIEGEDRFQKNGDPAVWDLVLLSKNRFCWHRTDWPNRNCTKTLRRC